MHPSFKSCNSIFVCYIYFFLFFYFFVTGKNNLKRVNFVYSENGKQTYTNKPFKIKHLKFNSDFSSFLFNIQNSFSVLCKKIVFWIFLNDTNNLIFSSLNISAIGRRCMYDSHCIKRAYCKGQTICTCKEEFSFASYDKWSCEGNLSNFFF